MKHIALALITATTGHHGQVHKKLSARHRDDPQHRTYLRLRRRVSHRYGVRTAGRNIVSDGMRNGRRATHNDVAKSIRILRRMLASQSVGSTSTTHLVAKLSSDSSLESCIISHESGGSPTAVNGDHEGIGQWTPDAWAEDGGTQYSATPLGASYDEQEIILSGEGVSGMEDQQAQYDGC